MNLTDGSFGVVETSDATTITVQALSFGTNNTFNNNDIYVIPRLNEISSNREGQLAFHEPGKYFTGEFTLEWSMLTADHDEADDFTLFDGNPSALTLDVTYQAGLRTIAQTSDYTGAFTFAANNTACEWIGF